MSFHRRPSNASTLGVAKPWPAISRASRAHDARHHVFDGDEAYELRFPDVDVEPVLQCEHDLHQRQRLRTEIAEPRHRNDLCAPHAKVPRDQPDHRTGSDTHCASSTALGRAHGRAHQTREARREPGGRRGQWRAAARRRRPSSPPVRAPRPQERTRGGGEAPLILIVDDQEDYRELYRLYLELVGFHVEVASDGEHALAMIERERPDLVVMDLAMPRLDGWEATRLIKSNPRTKDIPVIVLTAHASAEELQNARRAGADDVRMKPCLPRELLACMNELLGRPDDT